MTGIKVSGAGGGTMITTGGGTLELTVTVSLSGATKKTVTWSIINGTGRATINSSGLVTAVPVVVTGGVRRMTGRCKGALPLPLPDQSIPVTGITVSGAGGHK